MRKTKIVFAQMGIRDLDRNSYVCARVKFDDGIKTAEKYFNLENPVDAMNYEKLKREVKCVGLIANQMVGKTIMAEIIDDEIKLFLYHPMYYTDRLQKI